MARPKRVITPEGYLRCTHCDKAKHISQFYKASGRVWWTDPVTGTEHGRPHSWCSECLKARTADERTEERYNAEVERIRRETFQLGPPAAQRETSITGKAPWENEEE